MGLSVSHTADNSVFIIFPPRGGFTGRAASTAAVETAARDLIVLIMRIFDGDFLKSLRNWVLDLLVLRESVSTLG